jgi:magnesium chelatase subunit D
MAYEQAAQLHRQGVTPILVMLSDGRANVTLQGLGGRAQAQADALQWSAQWRQTGHRSLWIDTSIQPDPQVQNLAHTMGAQLLAHAASASATRGQCHGQLEAVGCDEHTNHV